MGFRSCLEAAIIDSVILVAFHVVPFRIYQCLILLCRVWEKLLTPKMVASRKEVEEVENKWKTSRMPDAPDPKAPPASGTPTKIRS